MAYFDEKGISLEFYSKAGKFIAGEMNRNEAKQFREYCKSNHYLFEELTRLERIWNVTGATKKAEAIALEGVRKNVIQRIHRSGREKKLTFYLQRIAAILFLPLLLITTYVYYSSKPVMEQRSVYNELDNAYGTVSKLTLPDGSKVWLNSGSHFRYPLFFRNRIRKVYLSGEAYFEVAKDKNKPFVVSTAEIDIVATGTAFDVMAYDNDNEIVATLLHGKISLAKETGTSHKLHTIISVKPGQKAILNKTEKKITVEKAEIDATTAWIEGKLIFRNDEMNVVVTKLERWYNTDIILVDKELNSYRYTATFVGETLPQVLELLKNSAPIEYKIYPRKKSADNTFTKGKVEIRLRDYYRQIQKTAK